MVFQMIASSVPPASREHLEWLFLSQLPTVDKVVGLLARRHALSPDDAEEFLAWARMRLIENDYGILARFRGEASLPTYLTVVLTTLFREYRAQEWGRWRPSAAAKRRGSIAVRIEQLVARDGASVSHAVEALRASGATSLSEAALRRIAAELPMRTPLRPVRTSAAGFDAPGSQRADDLLEQADAERAAVVAREVLDKALVALPLEERRMVRLHYVESMTVADIARELALPQKPLYRRLQRALAALRAFLERAGISREDVRTFAAER